MHAELIHVCILLEILCFKNMLHSDMLCVILISLQAGIYYDIHVTPQAPYSYVSFETNMEEVYNTVCSYIIIKKS